MVLGANGTRNVEAPTMPASDRDGISEYAWEVGDVDELNNYDEEEALAERSDPADDPVRMYLREIGQVGLLDATHEVWLSLQIAAERHLQTVLDAHFAPEAADNSDLLTPAGHIGGHLYDDIVQDYQQLLAMAGARQLAPPDLESLLDEVRSINAGRGDRRGLFRPRLAGTTRPGT